MSKGDKQEDEGYVRVHKITGTVLTERYCIYPKKGEDIMYPLFKMFDKRKVRIIVEDIDDSKEFKVQKRKGLVQRYFDKKAEMRKIKDMELEEVKDGKKKRSRS